MTEDGGRRTSRSNSYMEQENEWEREGLLDPAWEQQQKKVRYFTSVNHFGRKKPQLPVNLLNAKN